VIEVGVDVANASVMVIDNAERMGLAQLHQLRGRVGRGVHESTCVLLYRAPLSEMARARLAALRESTDGFEIAQRDLELRGPGELLGTRQTGLAQLRVADLVRDADLLITDIVPAMRVPSSSSSTGTPPIGFIFRNSGLRLSPAPILTCSRGTVMPFSARYTRSLFGFGAPTKS
jgi:ATP-dependent DNA helicase RecG